MFWIGAAPTVPGISARFSSAARAVAAGSSRRSRPSRRRLGTHTAPPSSPDDSDPRGAATARDRRSLRRTTGCCPRRGPAPAVRAGVARTARGRRRDRALNEHRRGRATRNVLRASRRVFCGHECRIGGDRCIGGEVPRLGAHMRGKARAPRRTRRSAPDRDRSCRCRTAPGWRRRRILAAASAPPRMPPTPIIGSAFTQALVHAAQHCGGARHQRCGPTGRRPPPPAGDRQ